jgi:hypothetical protein
VPSTHSAAAAAAPPHDDNPWLTVTAYQRRHGIKSRRTVWNWVAKGALEVWRRAPRVGVRVRDARPSV